MTVNLCTVSGTLVAPDGSPMPDVSLQFRPAPLAVRTGGVVTQVPLPVGIRTDASAGLSVSLAPGVYTVRARQDDGREFQPFLVDVPLKPAADLATILAHLPTPQTVFDAAASARTAERAAADAVAARDSVLTPEQYGAIGDGQRDDSAALQAMFDACRETGRPWRMSRRYFVGDATLTVWTSGDGSSSELITTAEGQSNPVMLVAALLDDNLGSDAALADTFNAALPLAKGTRRIPALGAWAGSTVRLGSNALYLRRGADTGSYRHHIFFEVLDAEGHIWPPLPVDVAAVDTPFTASRTILREWLNIDMPLVRVASGETNRGQLVRVTRPRVNIWGGQLRNETPAAIAEGFRAHFTTSVRWFGCHVEGLRRVSENYAYNLTGAGFELHGCSETNCRRGLDGTYASHVSVVGGSYPDGIGGHLIFGLSASSGAVIGRNNANTSPIHVSGGDINIQGCRIVAFRRVINARQDAPELIGQVALEGNDIAVDWSDETGTPEADLIHLHALSSDYDPGRAISFPEHIRVSGNTVRVSGTGHSGQVYLFRVSSRWENITAQDVVLNGRVSVNGNAFTFENGAPDLRITGAKRANWTGPGLVFDVADLDGFFQVYWGADAAAQSPAGRADFRIHGCREVVLRIDGGSCRYARAEAESATLSAAAGLTDPIGDEDWQVGRAILAGQFGLGGRTLNYSPVGSPRNWDILPDTAFLGNSSNSGANNPANGPGGNHIYAGWGARISANRASQMLMRVGVGSTNQTVFFRTQDGGTWKGWMQMMHQGMTLPTTQPSTPNTFWRDSANGNVVKLTPP